jgi:hypothetical protein
MIGLTAIQARYTAFSPKNSEEFSSASRSVKPGLIASGIVSAVCLATPLPAEVFIYVFIKNSGHGLQLWCGIEILHGSLGLTQLH